MRVLGFLGPPADRAGELFYEVEETPLVCVDSLCE
jgi:hypothetical protein